jgi:hypothetical protein
MLLEDFVTTDWVVRQKIWKPLRVARSGGAYGGHLQLQPHRIPLTIRQR